VTMLLYVTVTAYEDAAPVSAGKGLVDVVEKVTPKSEFGDPICPPVAAPSAVTRSRSKTTLPLAGPPTRLIDEIPIVVDVFVSVQKFNAVVSGELAFETDPVFDV